MSTGLSYENQEPTKEETPPTLPPRPKSTLSYTQIFKNGKPTNRLLLVNSQGYVKVFYGKGIDDFVQVENSTSSKGSIENVLTLAEGVKNFKLEYDSIKNTVWPQATLKDAYEVVRELGVSFEGFETMMKNCFKGDYDRLKENEEILNEIRKENGGQPGELINYKDGLRTGHRQSELWFYDGEGFHKFEGKSIPNVAYSEIIANEKNKEWSNTDYRIELKKGVKKIRLCPELHNPLFTEGCTSIAYEKFKKKQGIELSLDDFKKFLRVAGYESTLKSLEEGQEFFEKYNNIGNRISFNDGRMSGGRHNTLILIKDGKVFKFSGESISDVALVEDNHHTEDGKWSHTDYTILLASGVKAINLYPELHNDLFTEGCTSIAYEKFKENQGIELSLEEFKEILRVAEYGSILKCLEEGEKSYKALMVTSQQGPVHQISYNNGLRVGSTANNKSRQPSLWFLRKGEFVQFCGKSIDGIAFVANSRFTQNGKWSHTDYTILLAGDVKAIELCPPMHGYLFSGNDTVSAYQSFVETYEADIAFDQFKDFVKENYSDEFQRLEDGDSNLLTSNTEGSSDNREIIYNNSLSVQRGKSTLWFWDGKKLIPFDGKSIPEVASLESESNVDDNACLSYKIKLNKNVIPVEIMANLKNPNFLKYGIDSIYEEIVEKYNLKGLSEDDFCEAFDAKCPEIKKIFESISENFSNNPRISVKSVFVDTEHVVCIRNKYGEEKWHILPNAQEACVKDAFLLVDAESYPGSDRIKQTFCLPSNYEISLLPLEDNLEGKVPEGCSVIQVEPIKKYVLKEPTAEELFGKGGIVGAEKAVAMLRFGKH